MNYIIYMLCTITPYEPVPPAARHPVTPTPAGRHEAAGVHTKAQRGAMEPNGVARSTGHLTLWDIIPVFS